MTGKGVWIPLNLDEGEGKQENDHSPVIDNGRKWRLCGGVVSETCDRRRAFGGLDEVVHPNSFPPVF
jgi:hypothetical protein